MEESHFKWLICMEKIQLSEIIDNKKLRGSNLTDEMAEKTDRF